ncbi:ATP-binding cassette domain-containing protein [Lentibacillus cibarius]|uniref:ATP-binding cassette domain-containing protein n=1 Tax=Lentibacillus cibarius TaxID=2583219 RepID=A0A549YJL6_9BACI|nr:adenosylcobinamide amidohydrolase [Lentibacillus cibarius]TRM12087.1 ATP-binding cassette domain-containing protein [Lentibacillus cibarius]
MLNLEHVSGGYDGQTVIKDISFSVSPGEFFGILGPNGSGKTTLLKMVSGLIPCMSGSVQINNKNIRHFSRKALAKQMAVLPQLTAHAFSYTVRDTVALGRYAHHQGFFQTWTAEDEHVLQTVMEQTNITNFQDEAVQELSGGEQQRVFLAQALAQQPNLLLLDEPTNHLDLAYQKDLLDLLKKGARQEGLTVVSIFHDLNLASLYCDRLLLLHDGQKRALHTPDGVLTEGLIKEVYQTDVTKHPHPAVAKPQMHLLPDEDDISAEEVSIGPSMLHVKQEYISLAAPTSLRTLSSGVCGAGFGWNSAFVNRHVANNYDCSDPEGEMRCYLDKNGFDTSCTVGMMTAVQLADVAYGFWENDHVSLFTVVTAGVGNATDSTRSAGGRHPMTQGTINTWLFINGHVTEEAFIQAIITATEAKAQVLRELAITDENTGTIATGTSTDSVLVAATQQGQTLSYAGTATALGQLIGKSVYTETKKAIQRYQAR